jgi:hypothetical protein
MSQVNVNPGGSTGDGAAAAGMGAGMLMMLIVGLIILLLVFWFLLRPMFFGGPANVNVNVRSQDVLDAFRYLA